MPYIVFDFPQKYKTKLAAPPTKGGRIRPLSFDPYFPNIGI